MKPRFIISWRDTRRRASLTNTSEARSCRRSCHGRPSALHEIKHDGFRTIITLERGRPCAFTRNGHDWSDRYRRIVEDAQKLRCRSAVLDGEAVVQDASTCSFW